MHVLMTFPYSIGVPGGGTYAFLQTALYLKAAGVEVTVFFLESNGLKLFLRRSIPKSRQSAEHAHTLEEAGIKVISVPVSVLSFSLDSFYMRHAIASFTKYNKVDVIISWHHEAAFLSNIGKAKGIKLICRAAGNYNLMANNERGKIWSAITTYLLKQSVTKANAVWATSKFTRAEAINIFNLNPSVVKVIPEGINPVFLTARLPKSDNQPITRFLFFGIWRDSKGIFDALEAFGRLAAQGINDWQFRIAGWGTADIIQQTAIKYDILDQVKILGKLDHQCLVEALEWAQVAILPSKIESFGLAVAEAQASGVPVIAYDAGAVPEMVKDKVTGWLVPLDRVDLLVEAILEARANPAKTYCMGLSGRENIQRSYSWPSTVRIMLDEIERLADLQQ